MRSLLELPVELAPPAVAAPRAVLDHPEETAAWLAERGQAPLRARQIRRQIPVNRAESFESMTDLPLGLRAELTAAWFPLGTRIDKHLIAEDGTHKLLLRLHDDALVECVLLLEADRRTVCISTQVGCGM